MKELGRFSELAGRFASPMLCTSTPAYAQLQAHLYYGCGLRLLWSYSALERFQICHTQLSWYPTHATERSRMDGARSFGYSNHRTAINQLRLPFSEVSLSAPVVSPPTANSVPRSLCAPTVVRRPKAFCGESFWQQIRCVIRRLTSKIRVPHRCKTSVLPASLLRLACPTV